MKKNITGIIVFLVLVGGVYLIWDKSDIGGGLGAKSSAIDQDNKIVHGIESVKSGAVAEAIAEISLYQYTEKYANSNYGFSFKYPRDFAVSSIPTEDGEVILIQNGAKNIGVQILITPFAEGEIDITAEFIKAEIPDLKISEPREVLIGANRKGMAFKSDNEAFGGASREVWFVFNGNFYQISTYAEQDGFLQGLFGTWEFGNN